MKTLKLALTLLTLVCLPTQAPAVLGSQAIGEQCHYYSFSQCNYRDGTNCVEIGGTLDATTSFTTTYGVLDYSDSTEHFPYKDNSHFAKDPDYFAFTYSDPNGAGRHWNFEVGFTTWDWTLDSTQTDIMQVKLAVKNGSCILTEADEYTEVMQESNFASSNLFFASKTTPEFHFLGRIFLEDGDCFGPIVRVVNTASGVTATAINTYFHAWSDEC